MKRVQTMKRTTMRTAVAGLVALLAAANAQANDVINNITGVGGTTFFGALHTDSMDFTDVFTFSIEGSVIANLSLITIGSGANNIDFTSADLNGVAVTLSPNGFLETGSLGDTSLTGPLVLTVRGKSGAADGIFASYSGTMNVIPEPSTSLLMGLGLGGLALATRRARA
ncbi:FxDxF family PEP-CTERM protein [Myxococcota bacterium]|nr:FxDxF family PEP-CTERM protein [Myxococcota bacterium]